MTKRVTLIGNMDGFNTVLGRGWLVAVIGSEALVLLDASPVFGPEEMVMVAFHDVVEG